jgi:hypothetical protein
MKSVIVSILIAGFCFVIAASYLPASNFDAPTKVHLLQVASQSVNQTVISTPAHIGATNEAWQCEYFGNADLSGAPIASAGRSKLSANWGKGAPLPGLPVDQFSMRCISWRFFPALDNYQFVLYADGGVRLYVDDILFVNEWFVGQHQLTQNISLNAGPHALRLEYFDDTGSASLVIDWKRNYAGWEGLYYNNMAFEDAPAYKSDDFAHIENGLAFLADGEPYPGVVADGFSAIWRKRSAFQSGTYRFSLVAEGEAQVRINGRLWLDTVSQGQHVELDIPLASGKPLVEVHYANKQGRAAVKLSWQRLTY